MQSFEIGLWPMGGVMSKYTKYGFKIKLNYPGKPTGTSVKAQRVYLYKDDADKLFFAIKNKKEAVVYVPLNNELGFEHQNILDALNDPTQTLSLSKEQMKLVLSITAKKGYTGVYENYMKVLNKLKAMLESITDEHVLSEEHVRLLGDSQSLDKNDSKKLFPISDFLDLTEIEKINQEIMYTRYLNRAIQAGWSMAKLVLNSIDEDHSSGPAMYFASNPTSFLLLEASNAYLSESKVLQIIDEKTYQFGLAFRDFLEESMGDQAVQDLVKPVVVLGQVVSRGVRLQDKLAILNARLATYQALKEMERMNELLASSEARKEEWIEEKNELQKDLAALDGNAEPDSLAEIDQLIESKRLMIDRITKIQTEFGELRAPILISDYTRHWEKRPEPGTPGYVEWRETGLQCWQALSSGNACVSDSDVLWVLDNPVGTDIDKLPMESIRAYIRYNQKLYFANKVTNTLICLTEEAEKIKAFDALVANQDRQVVDKKTTRVHLTDGQLLENIATALEQHWVIDQNQCGAENIAFFKDSEEECDELTQATARLTDEIKVLELKQENLIKLDEEQEEEQVSDDSDDDLTPIESKKPAASTSGFFSANASWFGMRSKVKTSTAMPSTIDKPMLALEERQNDIRDSVERLRKILAEISTTKSPLKVLQAAETELLHQTISDALKQQMVDWIIFIEQVANEPPDIQIKISPQKKEWLSTYYRMKNIADAYTNRINKINDKKTMIHLRKLEEDCVSLIQDFDSNHKTVTYEQVSEQLKIIDNLCKEEKTKKKVELTSINLHRDRLSEIRKRLDDYRKKRTRLTKKMFGSNPNLDFHLMDPAVKQEGLFIKYLNERNATYIIRDWLSIRVALLLGCFGYVSERLERERYIGQLREYTQAYQVDPSEDNYNTLSELIDEGLTKPGQVRTYFFSPRVHEKDKNYDCTLHAKLKKFKARLSTVEAWMEGVANLPGDASSEELEIRKDNAI